MLQSSRTQLYWFALSILIYVEIWTLQNNSFITQTNAKAFIIALDLIIIAPLILWISNKLERPLQIKYVLPFLGLTLLTISQTTNSTRLLIGLGLAEVLLATYFLHKIAKASKHLRTPKQNTQARVQSFMSAAFQNSPASPIFHLAFTEIQLINLALTGWLKQPKQSKEHFSYHKNFDSSIMLAIALITMFEALPLHLLIHQWSNLAAWLITALHLYSLLWLAGLYQSYRHKPITLSKDTLELNQGLIWTVSIPLSSLLRFEKTQENHLATLKVSLKKKTEFTVTLKHPIKAYGLFGIRKKSKSFSFNVDENDRFEKLLRTKLKLCITQ